MISALKDHFQLELYYLREIKVQKIMTQILMFRMIQNIIEVGALEGKQVTRQCFFWTSEDRDMLSEQNNNETNKQN